MHAQSPLMVERRLSTGAAARVAGCHVTTIWRAIERGELPAVRLGARGHRRITREALEAWMQPTQQEKTA